MSEAFLGEIRMFAGNYAPQGWALCAGQQLQVAQNQALFVLIGNRYGGDGVTTFALPDLRGRVPLSQGQLLGGSNYVIATSSGSEDVTLLPSQMPAHTHVVSANGSGGEINSPSNAYWAAGSYYSDQAPNGQLATTAVSTFGGGQPHDNMMPYLVINFIIATAGIFPSQS